MAYSIERMPERISIGRETETGVTDVMIDCGAWVSKWPGMTLHAIHTPDGGTPYILQTETDGGVLVWHVTDADTATPGTGLVEIVGETDGRRKVSATVKVSVAPRMSGTVGDPPEAAMPWVESVIGAADRITGMHVQAETLDAGSSATAAWDGEQGLLTIGLPKGKDGKDGAPGKDAVVDDTLTQHGQAADAKVTGEAMACKLTEPSTGLAVGRYFRIAAIDESGHAVLEAVDLPSAPVQDVQVDGTSIVADGVANVNKYDVVRTAMCDGKGAAWTAAEQAAARERMGIPGDYELIEEIVLTEESRVARSKEPDGAPYNFATIMMRAEFPASDKTGNIYISYNIGNEYNNIISYFLYPYKADAVKYGYSKVWMENSRYRSGWWTCVENHGQFAQYYENPMRQDKYSIADGNIIGFSTDVMAAGTKITIYGVRA